MTTRTVQLLDRLASPPSVVAAEVIRDFPETAFPTIERLWAPERLRLPLHVQHNHWNWVNKLGHDRFQYLAILVGGSVEGLAAIWKEPGPSLLDPSALAVELAILEAAPWNLNGHPEGVRYQGVGTALLTEAVVFSRQVGLAGRVVLSALPQAEMWYRRRGMTEVGPKQQGGLVYFEYSTAQANSVLEQNGVTA
jgi:hypothetical protein